MQPKEKLVIIVEESVTRSVIKDTLTFVMFAGLLYFNHKYLSGNTFIDVLFILMVLLLLVGKSSAKVFQGDIEGAKKFLEDKS